VVFGELITQANDWHSVVGDDLEDLGYAFGSAVLPACGFGFDHARQRFFFVGYADGKSQSSLSFDERPMAGNPKNRGQPRSVVRPNGLPSRMAVLRAFGNAIVLQVAAEFIWRSRRVV
jgi:DNA (cytosine-5)-methyltransferase 1